MDVTIHDFNILRIIGTGLIIIIGSYGRVVLVEKKDNKKLDAMKELSKSDILKNG
jgi:hypothetical protein